LLHGRKLIQSYELSATSRELWGSCGFKINFYQSYLYVTIGKLTKAILTAKMSQYLTYSRFFTLAEADFLLELLSKEQIPFLIEEEVNHLDPIYIGANLDPMIVVKIPQGHFKKVNELLEIETAIHLKELDPAHYLNDFTNTELFDVIKNTDEWSLYDRVFAKKLLTERQVSVPIKPTTENVAENYIPDKLERKWVILGYLFSILGFMGLIMSLVILNSNKTLYNGVKVKMYDRDSLRHANTMLIISLITFAIVISTPIFPILQLYFFLN